MKKIHYFSKLFTSLLKDDVGSKMSGDALAVDLPWPGDWDRWGGGTSPPPQDVVRATDCKARWRGRPVREALASLGLEGPYATAAIGAGRVRVNVKEANGFVSANFGIFWKRCARFGTIFTNCDMLNYVLAFSEKCRSKIWLNRLKI